MPPVGDLDRVRGAGGGAFGVAAGPVPTDHLHSRVCSQPAGEGLGLTVGQHVDRLTGFHVDQDGGVAVTPPLCELVHPPTPAV
jgi:hypothetical protein